VGICVTGEAGAGVTVVLVGSVVVPAKQRKKLYYHKCQNKEKKITL
jgi:hypothetical protein